ncbi:MAG TPA: hypothetical protein PKY77_18735 [Phycisphaerae bacterium]|nr:hypothetical protein [Phycisphaerae bacterium]HRY66384.1 hypothetical protein [Phycisphaerae bacterium]HSA25909.1 hypothetical protein [Phycisphaerae bacterium]
MNRTRVFVGLVGVTIFAALIACNQPPAANPWRDDALSRDTWSTPTQDGILASGHAPVVRQRNTPAIEAPLADGAVPHWSLWFEDPFEDKGDGDGQSAWTCADYLAMFYSAGRFGLNTLCTPVSAVVVPPCTALVSDGVVGKDHDATVGRSPNPTASKGDFYPAAGAEPQESASDTAPAPEVGG